MSCATADPSLAAPKLPDADRAKMLEGVERMIYKQIRAFGIPAADLEDVAQDCRLVLWQTSGMFDPAGRAKWSTFAQTVVDNVLKNRRDSIIQAAIPGGLPTVEFDDETTADPATVGDPDGEDDDERTGQLATAVRRQLVGPALAALSPSYRRLVEAVVFGGLTIDQYAEQSGFAVKVVRTNLGNALGQLAKAGHVPADMASRLGLNVADLAARADGKMKARRAAARKELVGEALAAGLTVKEIAAQMGEPIGSVQRDARACRQAARVESAAPASAV